MQSQDNDKTLLGGFTLDLVYSIISEKGKTYLIEGGEVVGRGKDCDIFIDDKKISRNHAELIIKDGRLQINDLQSSNGTFRNGSKITEETNLSNGDIISFEKHIFNVKIEMAQEVKEEEPVEDVEEDDSDYTAVVDMSEEYLAKLSDASNKNKPVEAPPLVEKTKPKATKKENEKKKEEKKQVVKEKPIPKNDIKPTKKEPVEKVADESVPKSWVEETGAVDGTRMMGAGDLDALRAGVADANAVEVANNETDVSRLHCFIEGQEEEIIELNIGDYAQASGWEIGRDAGCDIVVEHASVSNRHAQIIHQNGRWKIVNLVSTNGIMINGQKKLTTYLTDGDKIGLGTVNLVFKAAKNTNKKVTNVRDTLNQSKGNFPLVPVLLGLILVVLAALIYMYMT